jgi:N-acetylglutamate synthase-like GNAT family acetyltransferase
MTEGLTVRAATDADADALISLISNVFSEYPGCVIDLGTLDRDLLAIASHAQARAGKFWVAERDGKAVACIGYTLERPGVVELKRLYVAKSERGRGLGERLYRLVTDAARTLGAGAIELWSDTRFKAAHAFYQKRGFVRSPETRALNDPSNTVEYHFRKTL